MGSKQQAKVSAYGMGVIAFLVLGCCGAVANFGDDDEPRRATTTAADEITVPPVPLATTASPTPPAAPTTTAPTTAAAPTPRKTTTSRPVYYADCAAVRRAGKAPLRKGSPGYRLALDRDRDGRACEATEGSGTTTGGGTTSTYYANCDAVRAAGKAPLYRGQPGYRSGLDRDSDGIACDT